MTETLAPGRSAECFDSGGRDDRRIAVRIKGVRRTFGPITAVDGITLDIASGSTVALHGPNGAGKSTTISMLLGLIPADTGTITVFDQEPELAVRAGQVGAMQPGASSGTVWDTSRRGKPILFSSHPRRPRRHATTDGCSTSGG